MNIFLENLNKNKFEPWRLSDNIYNNPFLRNSGNSERYKKNPFLSNISMLSVSYNGNSTELNKTPVNSKSLKVSESSVFNISTFNNNPFVPHDSNTTSIPYISIFQVFPMNDSYLSTSMQNKKVSMDKIPSITNPYIYSKSKSELSKYLCLSETTFFVVYNVNC